MTGAESSTGFVQASDVILVSRTLSHLSASKTLTSSQRYELALATALSEGHDVRILSIGAETGLRVGRLQLIPVAPPRGRWFGDLLLRLLREDGRNQRIISFGYEPTMIAVLWLAKLRKYRAFSIVFDTHVGALSRHGRIRRRLIDSYFRFGRYLLRRIDGVVVVTEAADKILRRRGLQVLLSRVPASPAVSHGWHPPTSTEPFQLMFAGALEPYNGIEEMLNAMNILNSREELGGYRLVIYGSGSEIEKVQDAASRRSDILYKGTAPQSEVDAELGRSHLALNLRRLDSEIGVYAFPSKLIELLGKGVPLISTPCIERDVLARYCYVLDAVSPELIAEGVRAVANNYANATARARTAEPYVRARYDIAAIASEIMAFMDGSDRNARV